MLFFEGNIPSPNYIMEWRRCARFPSFEVSEFGDLRVCVATRYRKVGQRVPVYTEPMGGYLKYTIPDATGDFRTVKAARLVAEAFLGEPPSPEHEVAHRGGSRISAYWRDLHWATSKENHADRITHRTDSKGTRNGRAKLTDEQVVAIRVAYKIIKDKPARSARAELLALAAQYGITENALDMAGKGYTWKHVPMG